MPPTDPRDYVVGRGKPPRHSQFQKGQSGNPRGRPRGTKSFKEILAKVAYQPMSITIKGKRKHVPALEAILMQAVSRAATSDWRFLSLLLKHLSDVEGSSQVSADPSSEDKRLSLEAIRALIDEADAAAELPD
jgi:hypothetical protein